MSLNNSLKREGHSGSRHAKETSPSTFSSRSHARANRFITLHFGTLGMREFALSQHIWKNCFSHRTCVGSRRLDVKVQAMRVTPKKHALHAPLLPLLAFFCPSSARVCFVRFLSRTSPITLLQYLSRITFKASAHKCSTCMKKYLPQISFQFARNLVTIVNFLQRIDVISELLCP